MGTGIDPKAVSAYMVHHVLNKSKTIKKNGKSKPKKKEQIFSLQKGHIKTMKHKISLPDQETINVFKKKPGRKKHLLTGPKYISDNPITSPAVKPQKSMPTISPKTVLSIQPSNTFEQNFENKTLFQWMIEPVNVDDFMTHYWEKKPLYIPQPSNKFSVLLSTPVIDDLLTSANIQYTKNVDITLYRNGVKEVLNSEGRARPHVVWDFYCDGCSLRMLNPQTFVPNIFKLTSELQEFFGCFVGSNAYLTPGHSQGFAPHYDDIEAFILQIEGKKRWRVYQPRTSEEELPRFSSGNFTDDILPEPTLDVLLNAGDVLYLPRGYIHQARTENDFHSLHVTISAFQCNAWIDLLQKAVPRAMENAWKKDIEFRKGLPRDYLQAAGLCRDKKHKSIRISLEKNLKTLICKLADHLQIDSSVDQMATKFLYDALPPVLTEEEKLCSVYGDGLKMIENGYVVGTKDFEFDDDIEIVLLRKFASRLVKEVTGGYPKEKKKVEYRLYYTSDNSLEYHAEQTSFCIVSKSFVPCIQYLFQSYPNFVTIKELPHNNMDEKIELVADLWERGIVRTKVPIMKLERCSGP